MKLLAFVLFASLLVAFCFAEKFGEDIWGDAKPDLEEPHREIPEDHEGGHREMEHEYEKHCMEKFVRKNHTRHREEWKNLTTVHLASHHKHFTYNFSFPRSKCCYKIHFFPKDLQTQVKKSMTCDQKATSRSGFYQLDLSLQSKTTGHHHCKVIRNEKGSENITCAGELAFDPTMQRSNVWHVFSSKCGSRDMHELSYFLNFTSEQDNCHKEEEEKRWYMKNTVGRAFKNAGREFEACRQHYPISGKGMIVIAVLTGLNTLFLIAGSIFVFCKLRGIQRGKNENKYCSNNAYETAPNSTPEKLPL